MERIIITSTVSPEVITLSEANTLFTDKGLIIIYNKKEQIVGSVVYNEGTYFLGLMKFTDSFTSLREIVEQYPDYIFKYID